MHPYTDGELDTFGLLQPLIQVSHRSEDTQTSPYCSLGIIFMSVGIAEIHQEPIAKELGDMPIVALDNVGTHPLRCTHHVPVVFRIELAGELRRVHQITEHHRELPTFSVWRRRCWRRDCLCREVVLRDCLLHRWWRG